MSLRTFLHVLKMGASSILAYRFRSVLTALGVAMGITTVLTITGIIEGLDRSFSGMLSSIGTGTLYVTREPWIILSEWWKYRGRPPVTALDAERLEERLSLAQVVVPFAFERGGVKIGDTKLNGVRIIGTTEHWPKMSGISPAEGRFLTRGEVSAGRTRVVVGADVAASLNKAGLGVQDRLELNGWPLTIVGIMASRGSLFGQSQDDFVTIPLPLFERMFGGRRSLSIGVVVDPEALGPAQSEVIGAMRAIHHLEPAEENDFSVNQQDLLVDLYKALTGALYGTALGLAAITVLVAGVGIMNIMLVAVAERTREIGIRKALGARPSSILTQFLGEAALVSGLGGLLGVVLGLLATRGIAAVTPLPAAVPTSTLLLSVLFGLGAGLLFGFLPAWRASRLQPVEALATGG